MGNIFDSLVVKLELNVTVHLQLHQFFLSALFCLLGILVGEKLYSNVCGRHDEDNEEMRYCTQKKKNLYYIVQL